MAFLKPKSTSCATCGQVAGIFTCRGCSDNFCLRHTNEHREVLEKQMNQIVLTQNQLQQDVIGQTTEQSCHIYLQQIERWEQQSIGKIRQVANDTRQQVLTTVGHRTDHLKEQVAQLTKQINKAQQDGEYFETNLRDWSDRLQKLRRTFTEQQKVRIHEDRNAVPFISRISLNDMSNETFTQPFRNVQYEKEHRKVMPDHDQDYSNSKEDGDYSSGVRSFRYKIEHYGPHSSILLGIVSKIGSEDISSYNNPTFYGWAEKNLVYLGGNKQPNYDGYRSDIQADDIFMLTLDCDREMISLTNERTQRTYVLEVDTTKCPLPWEPNVRFVVSPE